MIIQTDHADSGHIFLIKYYTPLFGQVICVSGFITFRFGRLEVSVSSNDTAWSELPFLPRVKVFFVLGNVDSGLVVLFFGFGVHRRLSHCPVLIRTGDLGFLEIELGDLCRELSASFSSMADFS